jgi:hypothetical protein
MNNMMLPMGDVLGLGAMGMTNSNMGSDQASYAKGLRLGQDLAKGGDPYKVLKGNDAATRRRLELFKKLAADGKVKAPSPEPTPASVSNYANELPTYAQTQAPPAYGGAEDILGVSPQTDPLAAYMQAQADAAAEQEDAQLAATIGVNFNNG